MLLFSCSVMSNPLQHHGLQHVRLPCPSPSSGACSNSRPSRWCHPIISTFVVPFSSCLQSFPASGSFPMSQSFALGGQSIRVSASASILPMNILAWFLLGWTGWLSLQLLEWVAYPFSSGSSQPRNQTRVSCIAGWFFTSWATREAQQGERPLEKVNLLAC